jgi:hypothetical protein
MGRRHRSKESTKAALNLPVSAKLKETRHEFQTIPQTHPIARQLLLDEIRRLEAEQTTAPEEILSQGVEQSKADEEQISPKSDDTDFGFAGPNHFLADGPMNSAHEWVEPACDNALPCDDNKSAVLASCNDIQDFSPRFIENETKCSKKIFIPHHEYPGVIHLLSLLART